MELKQTAYEDAKCQMAINITVYLPLQFSAFVYIYNGYTCSKLVLLSYSNLMP